MEKVLRYEKKFVLSNMDLLSLENILRFSKLKFTEHHPIRSVNSIYYDDSSKNSLNSNINGNTFRRKYRFRWYGNDKRIDNLCFEIKDKISNLTNKKIMKVYIKKPIELLNKNIYENLYSIIEKIYPNFSLKPVSSVHYSRKYFISCVNNIRATIDYNVFYRDINKDFNIKKNSKNIILEFKYNTDKDNFFRENLNMSSFRLSKNSKFINSLIEVPLTIT
jgi:hypothetical protein